jgi:hypothetical protein
MRSKQMWVRCGLLAVVVMSTCVAAAPSPGQFWPGLAGAITSLEATQVYNQVAAPKLDGWAVDWHGRLWLWLSCPTPGAVMRCTGDGSDPQYYSPVCPGVLIVSGKGTLKVRAFQGGMCASDILVITIR